METIQITDSANFTLLFTHTVIKMVTMFPVGLSLQKTEEQLVDEEVSQVQSKAISLNGNVHSSTRDRLDSVLSESKDFD